MSARGGVACLGKDDELCVCDMCLITKLQALRTAAPEVQRRYLNFLPEDDVTEEAPPAAPAPPPAAAPRSPIHTMSLFKLPLWPTPMDAEFDRPRTFPPREPSARGRYVIPPTVLRRIPNIHQCIDHVIDNANITGPRKEAAIFEAIDEILAICERKFLEEEEQA